MEVLVLCPGGVREGLFKPKELSNPPPQPKGLQCSVWITEYLGYAR